MKTIKEVKREKHEINENDEKIKLPDKEMSYEKSKILQLEFDLKHAKEQIFKLENKIERLNNIINKLELNLKLNVEDLEENGFSQARIDEDKEILRFIEYLKESDKE